MSILSLDDYISSVKQRVPWVRTTVRTSLAATPFTMFDVAGTPGAGDLPGRTTSSASTSGSCIMPTDATNGFPYITATTGSLYISKIEYSNSVASRLQLFDMLCKSGSYAFGSALITLSNLDISSRCPDYSGSSSPWGVGNEIWVEVVTAFATGNTWSVQVGYTNQAGNSASTVNSIAQANAVLILGKMFLLPLASGDSGVQKLNTILVTNAGTLMTAGTFNVLIMRPLWTSGRVPIANAGDTHDMLKTGLPQIYPISALYPVIQADSTSTGLPEYSIEIASK